MPVTNVACPACGKETLVSIPDNSTNVFRVSDSEDEWNGRVHDTMAACQSCDENFWVWYKRSENQQPKQETVTTSPAENDDESESGEDESGSPYIEYEPEIGPAGIATTVLALPPSILAVSKLVDQTEDSEDESRYSDADQESLSVDVQFDIQPNVEPTEHDWSPGVPNDRTDRLSKPAAGTLDWHKPINKNFEKIENDLENIEERIRVEIENVREYIKKSDETPRVAEQKDLVSLELAEGSVVIARDTSNVYVREADNLDWLGKLDYRPELEIISERVADLSEKIDRLDEKIEVIEEQSEL